MQRHLPDRLQNGSPTAVEIFRVFRNTTTASIEGLKLLLAECADLRAELVTIRGEQDENAREFSARQQNRILELIAAARELDLVLFSLPIDGEEGSGGG